MAMLVLCLIFSLGRVFAEEDLQADNLEELLAELDSDPLMTGLETRKVDTQLDESVFYQLPRVPELHLLRCGYIKH